MLFEEVTVAPPTATTTTIAMARGITVSLVDSVQQRVGLLAIGTFGVRAEAALLATLITSKIKCRAVGGAPPPRGVYAVGVAQTIPARIGTNSVRVGRVTVSPGGETVTS